MAYGSFRDLCSIRSSFVVSSLMAKLSCLTVSLVSVWGYWSPSPYTRLSRAPSIMAPLTSRNSPRSLVYHAWLRVPLNLLWMPPSRGVHSRSLLLTRLTSSHMPGTWTPPGLNNLALAVNSDIGFRVIKRVARTGIHIFRGSSASRHLRHFGLCDSLHMLRKDPRRAFRNAG